MNPLFSSIRNKLILYMLIASTISFSISLGYYLSKKANAFENAKMQMITIAENGALEIKKELARPIGIVQGLKYSFLRTDIESVIEKDRIYNPAIYHTLKENPSFLGVWYSMELSKYDNTWGNQPGRRSVSYYKNSDGDIGFKIDSLDIGGVKNFTGYHKVKEAKEDAIMEPYWCDYTKEGEEQFLETTLAAPVLKDGEFMGLVGIDLELKSFREIVNKIKGLGEGFSFLLSNGGVYVSHPDDTIVGMKFSEVNPQEEEQYNITENIGKGNRIEFLTNYDTSGEQIYVLHVPVQIGDTNTPWSLGIVVKKSEILHEANKDLRNSILASIVSFIILLVFIFIFTARIILPIRQGVGFAKSISEGDLSSQIKASTNDEIGVLAESLNNMSVMLKKIMVQLNSSIQNLAGMSKKLSQSSREIAEKANKQAGASQNIIVSIEQVAANIKNNAANAKQTEKIAENSVKTVQISKQSSQHSIEAMQSISAKIGLITDIAFQTNILALNAAVESARAGAQGKGFAVVATEVRKLAERSKVAADEITRLVDQSVTKSEVADLQLGKVVPEIENILDLVKNIAYASAEQDSGISLINTEISELDLIARNNADTAENLAQNANELSLLSDELSKMIKFFRI